MRNRLLLEFKCVNPVCDGFDQLILVQGYNEVGPAGGINEVCDDADTHCQGCDWEMTQESGDYVVVATEGATFALVCVPKRVVLGTSRRQAVLAHICADLINVKTEELQDDTGVGTPQPHGEPH